MLILTTAAALTASAAVTYLISFSRLYYAGFLHLILDSLTTFLACAVFILIWHSFERSSTLIQIIGLTILPVIIFNTLHLYASYSAYYASNLTSIEYYLLVAERYTMLVKSSELFMILTCLVYLWLAGYFLSPDRTNRQVSRQPGKVIYILNKLKLALKSKYFKYPALAAVIVLSANLYLSFPQLEKSRTDSLIQLNFFYIAVAWGALLLLFSLFTRAHGLSRPSRFYLALTLSLTFTTLTCAVLLPLPDRELFVHLLKIGGYYCLLRSAVEGTITYFWYRMEQMYHYLHSILDCLPLGIITYDENLRANFINKQTEKLLSYRREELMGLTAGEIAVLVYPPHGSSQQPVVNQLKINRESFRTELRTLRNRYGEEFTAKVEVLSLPPNGYVTLLTDTRREQELANLRLQTRTVLDAISNLVLITDPTGRIINANRAFYEKTESQVQEIIGSYLDTINGRYHFNPPLTLNPGGENQETSFLSPSGKCCFLLVQTAPIKDINQRLIGYVLVASDITSLKEKQEKLRQQEKMAALGTMAAGIVHEIRNPLTAVKGFSQLIAAKAPDGEIRSYAEIISQEVNGVNRIISDFLTFARPKPPAIKAITLHELFDAIQFLAENQCSPFNIKTSFSLSGGETLVWADPMQIKQVMLNMIKNAVEAMEKTPDPHLTLTAGYNALRSMIFITIADNGCGIPGEHISRLGTPFFSTKDRGTGLGLSICYQIINEHGGLIEVESIPGSGTAFTIWLPAAVPQSAAVTPIAV